MGSLQPRFSRAFGTFLAASLILPLSSAAQNKDVCGIVIGLTSEEWRTTDARQLTLGAKIAAGSGLPASTPDGTLTVWFEGKEPQSYSCSKSCQIKACPEPKLGPEAAQGVWELVFHQPLSRYFTAESRGLEGTPKEAVLLLKSAQLDVAPAMADLGVAEYWIRFEALRNHAGAPSTVRVQWSPGKSAIVSPIGIKPGLYRLSLVEPSGESTGSDAWVLVCDPRQYPTKSAAFQQWANTTATWPSNVHPAAIRATLRATLESLAGPATISVAP